MKIIQQIVWIGLIAIFLAGCEETKPEITTKSERYCIDENFKQYVWCNKGQVFNSAIIKKNVRDIYINTCNDFYYQKEGMALFKPINKIQILIEKYTQRFSSKTIGVHIRRTDNTESIQNSPLELYIHQMNVDLSLDKEVDLKAGMIGAMIDLYCLAKCSKIYGSYWSSFSEVAARIGDIPLKVIKKA